MSPQQQMWNEFLRIMVKQAAVRELVEEPIPEHVAPIDVRTELAFDAIDHYFGLWFPEEHTHSRYVTEGVPHKITNQQILNFAIRQ